MGLGATVLGSILAQRSSAELPELPHFKPRAKHVIFLFMGGAPSQIELYDYKPGLESKYKELLPDDIRDGQRVTAMTDGSEKRIQPSIFKFAQQGQCGRYMSELLPNLSTVADDLCFIKSMRTEAINHDEGKTQMCTGSQIQGKPSLGAWLSYGLGSLNRNLPDFIVLNSAFWSGDQQNVQALYSRLWGTGFLPSKYQGVPFQIGRAHV